MWKEGHSKYHKKRIHENIIYIFQPEGLWPLWKAVKLVMTLPLYIAPGMIADSLSVPIFVNQISAWATSGGPLSSLVRVVNITNHASYAISNLTSAKKLLVNDKIKVSCPTKTLPEHHIKLNKQQKWTLKFVRLTSFQKHTVSIRFNLLEVSPFMPLLVFV